MDTYVINGDSLTNPDINALARVIYLSGPREFDYICGNDAVDFIKYCWQKDTLFGARYHILIKQQRDIVGTTAAYTLREYIILLVKTAVCALRFFPLGQAVVFLYRGIKLKRLMRFPSIHSLYLAHLSVKHEYRGMGMATSLLSRALDIADERKLKNLTLDVRQDNTGAIALYEKLGYTTKVVIKATEKEQNYQLCNTRRMVLLTQFSD